MSAVLTTRSRVRPVRALARLLGAGLLVLLVGWLPAMAARPGDSAPDGGRPTEQRSAGQVASAAEVSAASRYAPGDSYTATWKRADALKVALDASTTTPRIPSDFPVMTDQVWLWDTWPLTGLDTKPVSFHGWSVIFSLTAPRNIDFDARHGVARIGYFYSRDGHSWIYGGPLFPPGYSLGAAEWAGTAILTGSNTVNAFYTASGDKAAKTSTPQALSRARTAASDDPTYPTGFSQRLAMAAGQIHADSKGVWFTGFRQHRVIAQADGRLYQTLEQSGGGPIIYAFRDPFVFRDPTDHRVYALFEGNTAGVVGTYQCRSRDLGPLPPGQTVPSDANLYTGNIGLMQATSADLTHWKLLPPLLSANCVNQQTERPHIVVKDGLYHLFTISHTFTYAPGLTGPDGVYGFVGPSLRSDYQPMNGSGLVLGNPADAPYQNYSHEVLPNLMVQSFIDRVPTASGATVAGGTLAPTLQLAVEGATSHLTRVLPYGYIPAMVRR